MIPIEVTPKLPNPALPNADWADAFEVTTYKTFSSMKDLATATVGSMPPWAKTLLAIRNVVVRPLGLKPDGKTGAPGRDARVDIFPIIDESADRIVLGLDDRHLNFRIVLERTASEDGSEAATRTGDRIRVTTLVRRHNLFGRAYIAAITPFHKAIAAASLKQAA